MKFFDKEWMKLQSKIGITEGFDVIENKEYSDSDIEKLYKKRLKQELKIEKEAYNTKPDFSYKKEMAMDEDLELTDMIVLNEKTGEIIIPKSREEALKYIEKEEEKAIQEFNDREVFDEEEFENDFKENYEIALKNQNNEFPKWLFEEVDERLIALNYLTRSAFQKLREEEEIAEEKLNQIEEEASKILSAQHIPYKISEKFDFYEARVKSFEVKENNNYEMRLVTEDDRLMSVIFKHSKILENEKIDFKKNTVYFVCHELYLKNKIYEVHMLLEYFTEKSCEYKYITLQCEDIKISQKD
jgi:hypothetical protein